MTCNLLPKLLRTHQPQESWSLWKPVQPMCLLPDSLGWVTEPDASDKCPSSRLPRPLFPGRPARPRAGPFTFKQSYEVAGAAAPGAQRDPGAPRTPASPASPRGTRGGTRSPGEACGPYLPPSRPPGFRAGPARDSAAAPDRESGARPRPSEGWRGWRRRPSLRAALSKYSEEPGGMAGHTGGDPTSRRRRAGRVEEARPSRPFSFQVFSELEHRC